MMNEILKASLSNWHTLNSMLSTFREDQVLELLELEKQGKKREDVLVRLHQRYNKLRYLRERAELKGDGI
jgi:DNA polymerase III delta prime subunit